MTAARARRIVPLVLGLIGIGAIAQEAPRWSEDAKVFAVVANHGDTAIIAEADAAIASLGFHRDSAGTRYPGNRVPGIFASYKAHAPAAAMLAQASRPDCMVFSVTNYEKVSAGLATNAVKAVHEHFREAFGTDVRFFSDPECKVALKR